jgi:hypothetical protein
MQREWYACFLSRILLQQKLCLWNVNEVVWTNGGSFLCGGIEVSHNLKILSEEDGGKIRIVDDVKLRRLGLMRMITRLRCHGHFQKSVISCLDDFMDQVLSSMARLRFLVENKRFRLCGSVREIYHRSYTLLMCPVC